MTREELEEVLACKGWWRYFHGTHSDVWQNSGHDLIEMTDKGIEIWINKVCVCPRMPWRMITVEDGKLKVNLEVKL